MKNLLNILLVVSLFTWIFGGMLVPIIHLVDTYFYEVSEYKEMALSAMLYSLIVVAPIGAFNVLTGGSPNNTTKKPSCKSCKKKKK
jgi:hypothetical protein